MPPGASQPFDGRPIRGFACDSLQAFENVIEPHLPQTVEQRPRIVQHHARPLAFVDELRNKFAHALVTPMENRSVVVVADLRVIHHVLQVADDCRCAEVHRRQPGLRAGACAAR